MLATSLPVAACPRSTPGSVQDAEATPSVAPQRVQVKKYGDVYIRRFLNGGNLWVMNVWLRQPAGWRVAAVQTTTAKK